MKLYLKLLFCFLFFANVLTDELSLFGSTNSTSDSFLVSTLLGINSTNSTSSTVNNTTPILYNCTQGANTTDLSQCTPVNITLSYECTKVNYDFLIYSMAWQPKLCNANSKDCAHRSNEVPKWRIQGLRGSFRNGTRPVQCCSDKQLKINELNSLLPDLKQKWYHDKDSTVDESIIEEWNLHGSCVQESEQKTSVQLHSKSLDLYNKLPIQEWLSNAKIEPSNEKRYGLQFFNYTISSKLQKKYQLRCKTFDYEKRISIIDMINVCVDKQTSEIIDCPFDFDSNCLEMLYYPTNLLEYKIPEEVLYRDMNYYRYQNYHSNYSPMSPFSPFRSAGLGTGLALGATGATAALAIPAAYYFMRNQNKLNKYKYNNNNFGGGGGYSPGGYGSSMPWYSSASFANSFAQPPPSYFGGHNAAGNNFGNLGTSNNLYPRQSYGAYPTTVFSGVSNNKNFGGLNVPSYPGYPNSGSNLSPSYPAYPNSNSKPSYPAYGSSNLPQAPPPYSKVDNKNSPYPRQDNPPSYSSIDKNKPSYPSYGSGPKDAYKPSAPSFSDISSGDKAKSGGLYPKLPSEGSGKYSPSAPSYSDVNKPSYPSSNSKPSSTSVNSKPKSSGGIFGGLWSKISGSSSSKPKSGGGSSSSYGRSSGSRGGGSRGGGSFGRSRG